MHRPTDLNTTYIFIGFSPGVFRTTIEHSLVVRLVGLYDGRICDSAYITDFYYTSADLVYESKTKYLCPDGRRIASSEHVAGKLIGCCHILSSAFIILAVIDAV